MQNQRGTGAALETLPSIYSCEMSNVLEVRHVTMHQCADMIRVGLQVTFYSFFFLPLFHCLFFFSPPCMFLFTVYFFIFSKKWIEIECVFYSISKSCKSEISWESIAINNAMYSSSLIVFYIKTLGLSNKPIATHHTDFEGIEQVKGQCSHQVDDEPCGQVMNADLPSIEDHLARLADIRCAKIKNNIWQDKQTSWGFGYCKSWLLYSKVIFVWRACKHCSPQCCYSAANLWWTVSPLRYHWQLCYESGRHHRRWSTHCKAPSQRRRMWQVESANPNQLWRCCSEVRWIWTSWHLLPCTPAEQADPQTHSGQDRIRTQRWHNSSNNSLHAPTSNPSRSVYEQWRNSVKQKLN